MLKKVLLIILFILSIKSIKAQESYKKYSEPNHIKNILINYSKQLELTKNQHQNFEKIILVSNKELSIFETPLTKEGESKFNKIVKEEFIKIYNLLNKEQLNKYKRLKKEIEPYKNYKI
ncbi:hypothetical protein C7447_103298 [Tenacibaculum adriaticum]|uniref:LTXXQ motif family protein n=1 Tax=Tenacibaculum adriaticum TaxID=413713 RepID=A0A5S5DRW6_9FLAO|nr:hypothetical protein [Tenacibaculum adriaticum]TYP98128.1 hypothetical protein C7447_103298 [Tenacibaculum adriaticum]